MILEYIKKFNNQFNLDFYIQVKIIILKKIIPEYNTY